MLIGEHDIRTAAADLARYRTVQRWPVTQADAAIRTTDLRVAWPPLQENARCPHNAR